MALEKKWNAVPPQALTVDGNTFGYAVVADTAGFKTKQAAYLKNSANQTLAVQVKRVLSSTTLIVGAIDQKIASWTPLDISAWTIASGAVIGAEEQDKIANPTDGDHYKAIYESDPIVADRVISVDKYGQFYDKNNPVPVIFDGTIAIGEVEVIGPSGHLLDPNTDGSVKTVQIFTKPFDSITATYPSTTQEVYQSRVGGIGGTVQETVTVNYTDITKNLILNVART